MASGEVSELVHVHNSQINSTVTCENWPFAVRCALLRDIIQVRKVIDSDIMPEKLIKCDVDKVQESIIEWWSE